MATREAKIKVTLDRGAAKAGLKGLERDTASSAKRMGGSLSRGMSAGLGNVKKTLRGMGSGLIRHMKTMATLGGAIGIGVMVKQAVNLQHQYRTIAYNISKIPGHTKKWQDVQKMVNAAVDKTGAKAEDLATAFDTVFKATGKFDESAAALEAIGTMSTATGASVESLANVAQMAIRKFGISKESIADVLAEFESLTGVGGAALDELGRRFGMMAGAAVDAGMEGREGMKSMLTMLTLVDDKIGERAEPAIKRMFEVLREGGVEIKAVQKAMGRGFKFKAGMGAMERLQLILQKGGKARATLVEKLTGDAGIAFKELTKTFDATMSEALEQGKPKAVAAQEAADELGRALSGADRTTRTYADNVAEAQRNIKDDPQIKFQKALNKITEAVSKPEVLEAINKLADSLPGLAEGFAKLLKFVVDNPLLSGGLAVGGRLGVSMGAGMLQSQFGGGAEQLEAQASTAAGAIKNKFLPSIRGPDGLAANAGAIALKFGVAATAAYGLGKALEATMEGMEKQLDENEKARLEASKAIEVARAAKDPEKKMFAQAEALKVIGKERAGIEEAMKERGMLENFIDMMANIGGGRTAMDDMNESIKLLNAQEKKQLTEMDKVIQKQLDGAKSTEEFSRALDLASEALGGIAGPRHSFGGGKPGATRGPTQPDNKAKPGAEPAGRK